MRISFLTIYLLILYARTFEFVLPAKGVQCFGEELSEMTLVSGQAQVLTPGKQIIVRIFDSQNAMIHQRPAASDVKYSFTVHTGGTHQVCVDNLQKEPIQVEFSMKSGVAAKDYSNLAWKSDLDPLDRGLKSIEESVKQIHEQTQYQREREEEMRNTNISIHGRVIGYSIGTIAMLFMVSIIQIVYLKNWFRTRKII